MKVNCMESQGFVKDCQAGGIFTGFFKYGNQGGIQKVIDREPRIHTGYYSTIQAAIDSVKQDYLSNYNVIYYGYDNRLFKPVLMIVADHKEYEQQFVAYLIPVDEVPFQKTRRTKQ